MAEMFKLTVKRGVGRKFSIGPGLKVRLTVDEVDQGEVQAVPTSDVSELREYAVAFDAGAKTIEVSVSDTFDPDAWPSIGRFRHAGGGTIVTTDAPAFENQALMLESSPSGGAVHMLVAHLFRVREVTDKVKAGLGLTNWGVNALNSFWFVDPAWAPPASPTFGSVTGDSQNDNLVLEVANVVAPKLIAVSFPPGIARAATDIPVCIFIHPMLGQQGQQFNVPYPWDHTYLNVLSRYTQYFQADDPLTNHPKGLPLQIAAAQRTAVLLLPLGRLHGTPTEIGAITDSVTSASLISEILQFMAMRKGNGASTPAMGRMALAAFSSGHDLFNQFLDNHAGTDLYEINLSELYCFDPMADLSAKTVRINDVVARINTWRRAKKARSAATGNNEDRVVRIYAQSAGPVPVNGGSWAAGGGDFTTLALLPPAAWTAALGRTSAPGAMEVHQIIPATMMTHAMRTSAFPKRSPP